MKSLWQLTGELWDRPIGADTRSPHMEAVLAEIARRKKGAV